MSLTETYEWPGRGFRLKTCGLIPVWEYRAARIRLFLRRDLCREEDAWTAVFQHLPSGVAFRADASTPELAMAGVDTQILDLLSDIGSPSREVLPPEKA